MTTTFIDRLEHELLAGIQARRRRRRAGARIAGVGLAVATALAVAMGGIGANSTKALAITNANGGTRVRIVDATANPDQIEEELNAAGIAADVAAVPVERQQQGRWITVGADPPEKTEEILSNGLEPDLMIPDGTTYVYLVIGRAPRDGETATRPECLRLSPMDHAPD